MTLKVTVVHCNKSRGSDPKKVRGVYAKSNGIYREKSTGSDLKSTVGHKA